MPRSLPGRIREIPTRLITQGQTGFWQSSARHRLGQCQNPLESEGDGGIQQRILGVTVPDDRQLITTIALGDPEALVMLYDRYGRMAFGLAYRILGDAATAEEVVQDAFLRVWRQAESFDANRGNVRAWLFSIVHHRAIDLLRGRYGKRRTESALDEIEHALATPDIWGEVSQTLQQEQIRTAVRELPVEQRHTIELAFFEGLTHSEIAERTGVPLGTIKSRMRLGLRKLRDALATTGV